MQLFFRALTSVGIRLTGALVAPVAAIAAVRGLFIAAAVLLRTFFEVAHYVRNGLSAAVADSEPNARFGENARMFEYLDFHVVQLAVQLFEPCGKRLFYVFSYGYYLFQIRPLPPGRAIISLRYGRSFLCVSDIRSPCFSTPPRAPSMGIILRVIAVVTRFISKLIVELSTIYSVNAAQ